MRSFLVLGTIALLAGCAATSGPADLPATGFMLLSCSSPRGYASETIHPGDAVTKMQVSASKDGSITFTYRDPYKVGDEVKKVVVPAGYDCNVTAASSAGTK